MCFRVSLVKLTRDFVVWIVWIVLGGEGWYSCCGCFLTWEVFFQGRAGYAGGFVDWVRGLGTGGDWTVCRLNYAHVFCVV